MQVDARPEPAPGDAAALRIALEALASAGQAGGRSAWWHEGVRENLDAEPDEGQNP